MCKVDLGEVDCIPTPISHAAVPASALNGTSIEDVASNDNHTVTVNLDQSPLDSTVLVTNPIETDRKERIKSLAYIETLRAVRNPAVSYLNLFWVKGTG